MDKHWKLVHGIANACGGTETLGSVDLFADTIHDGAGFIRADCIHLVTGWTELYGGIQAAETSENSLFDVQNEDQLHGAVLSVSVPPTTVIKATSATNSRRATLYQPLANDNPSSLVSSSRVIVFRAETITLGSTFNQYLNRHSNGIHTLPQQP
jgi:hypothetical protein